MFEPDSDFDGYSDRFEIDAGYQPVDSASRPTKNIFLRQTTSGRLVAAKNDPDGDGLDTSFEFESGLNPNNADSDGDGYDDGRELLNELDPLVKQDVIEDDSDADGLFDQLEVMLGTSPFEKDSDRDKLSDPNEILLGLDPRNPDTDGDGLLDGWLEAVESPVLFKFD